MKISFLKLNSYTFFSGFITFPYFHTMNKTTAFNVLFYLLQSHTCSIRDDLLYHALILAGRNLKCLGLALHSTIIL